MGFDWTVIQSDCNNNNGVYNGTRTDVIECKNWPWGWVYSNDLKDNFCQVVLKGDVLNSSGQYKAAGTNFISHGYSNAYQNGIGIFSNRTVSDSNCTSAAKNQFVFNEGTQSNCDIKNNKLNYTSRCNNWPGGWTASQDVVNNCKPNAPNQNVVIDGQWVGAKWDDSGSTNCAYNDNKFVYNENLSTNNCKNVGKRNVSKKCNNWPYGWSASDDVVKLCEKNKPVGSNVTQFSTEVWSEWIIDDDSCKPSWAEEWSNRDGCQADGQKRWSRKINANGLDWDIAAKWLIDTDTAQHKFSKVWYEKDALGMWVIALRNDNDCFVYNENVVSDGCALPNKRKQSKKCNNWPIKPLWVASNDVVNACKTNAPIGSNVNINGTEVWAHWTIDDDSCKPTPERWVTGQCSSIGVRNFWTKVDTKGGDWAAGAKWLAEQYTVGQSYDFGKGNQEVTRSVGRSDVTGAYVDIYVKDTSCNAPADKPVDKPADKPVDKPADKPTDKPTESTPESTPLYEKSTSTSIDQESTQTGTFIIIAIIFIIICIGVSGGFLLIM